MSDCYNTACPFHPKGNTNECPCAALCSRYDGDGVNVYTSNRTEPEYKGESFLSKKKSYKKFPPF